MTNEERIERLEAKIEEHEARILWLEGEVHILGLHVNLASQTANEAISSICSTVASISVNAKGMGRLYDHLYKTQKALTLTNENVGKLMAKVY